jgi:hypothetical protein
MKNIMIREIAIYVILLIVLAFTMHPDLLSGERFELMGERGNYFHPLLYTLILYLILLVIRYIIKKISSLFRKKVS